MSKLKKFRRSPQLFFADVKSPLVRRLGVGLTTTLVDKYGFDKLLYDPVETVASSGIPLLSELAGKSLERARLEREQLLAQADSPLVSIIVPAHNSAKTIEAAIASLQRQSYKNLEIIVVDDHSSDRTTELVSRMATHDPRVRLCRSTSLSGAATTRNIGMQEAQGEFITFQDADDRSAEDRVERQLALLLTRPHLMLSVCDYQRQDASGSPVSVNGRSVARSIISMMFRRKPVLSRLGYMRAIRVSEDAEYYERIKLLYGEDCEAHILKILYFAGFDTSSLLFSDGKTRVDASGDVLHSRSPQAEADLQAVRAWHQKIDREGASPYVNVQGETA